MSKKKPIDNIDKFKFPVYIHSHASQITNVLKSTDIKLITLKAQKEVDENYNNLSTMVEALKNKSQNPVIKAFYKETHDTNGRRKSTSLLSQLISLIIKYRNNAMKETKKILSKKIEEFFSGSGADSSVFKRIVEKMGEQVGEKIAKNIADNVQKYVSSKESKKSEWNKHDLKKMKVSELMNTTLLKKQVINGIMKHWSSKVSEDSYMQNTLQEVIKAIELELKIVLTPPDESAQTLINMIESHAVYYNKAQKAIASGFLFEYVLYESLKNGVEVTLEINGEKQTFILSAKSTGTSDHGFTTDIVLTLANAQKEINMGLSLKANMKWGRASTNFIKILEGKPFIDLNQLDSLLYYFANVKALSIFAAPEKYDKVIGDNGEINYPQNQPIRVTNLDWIKQIQEKYSYLTFVKGLIGQLLNENPDLKGDFGTEPPLFLTFLEYDYWMWEILDEMVKLIKDPSKSDILKKYISYQEFSWNHPIFKSFTESNLKDLFLVKKTIEASNEDRYKDFLTNDIDVAAAQKAGISKNLLQLLYDWSNEFNEVALRKILFTVKCNVPINELVK